MTAVNMPSLNIDLDSTDTRELVIQVLDYVQALRKQINFVLMSLEEENMPSVATTIGGIKEGLDSATDKAEHAEQIANVSYDKVLTVEEVQEKVSRLMANMLGGYYIMDEANAKIYIANAPTIEEATEWWEWGIGGFAHYVNGELKTGVTADNSIVAMLIAANIVTADLIQTGKLQSKNGDLVIDLDNNIWRTPNININNNGMVVNDGAIIVRDKNNATIITADGLKLKYVFMSSGELKGWQKVGIWNEYGNVLSHHAFITAEIPTGLTIESAILTCKSMPRLFTGWTAIPDGYYHARNLRLFKIENDSAGYIDFPAHSEYDLIMDVGGQEITNQVWGSRWSPTGQGVKYKEADVKDYLSEGRNVFLVKSADSITQANERYGGGMQFELIVTGYLRG